MADGAKTALKIIIAIAVLIVLIAVVLIIIARATGHASLPDFLRGLLSEADYVAGQI